MSDLFVFNGHIQTMDSVHPQADALVIRRGRITAIGEFADLEPLARGAKRLDVGGATILPGFIDSHVHFWRTGLMEQMLDLREATSIAQVLRVIGEGATVVSREYLLMARGFHDTKMRENRYPTLAELDSVAPDHVLYVLHNNGHSCVVNSSALRFLDLPPDTEGVETDPATREPSGVLRGKVAFQVQARLLTLRDPTVGARCLGITSELAVRAGVTTAHCLEGGRLEGDPDVADFRDHQAELPLNTLLYYQITDVERIEALGLPRIGGCVLIDGSPAAHTGALFEPYSDRPDTMGPTFWTQDELDDWVWRAHSRGLQIVVHATSERAIDQMLTAYERALVRMPRQDHRHRIDHFYFPRLDDLPRAAALGVCGGVQPAFEPSFRDMYLQRLGPERVKRIHPYRSLLDAGVRVGGGSDSFVTPIDPIAGIHAAVNQLNRGQRVTAREAVRMFTYENAYLGFEEAETGTLTVGKRGDLVVLSDDPLTTDPEGIGEISVHGTVVRGELVFTA